jgi:hypothetical protein
MWVGLGDRRGLLHSFCAIKIALRKGFALPRAIDNCTQPLRQTQR